MPQQKKSFWKLLMILLFNVFEFHYLIENCGCSEKGEARLFCQLDILSTCHFVICQLDILSTWLFVWLTFCQIIILPACQFANFQFCQCASLPTCQFANLLVCQLASLPTSHYANLSCQFFYQLYKQRQTCHLTLLSITGII